MALYETTFIVRQDVSVTNAQKVQEHFVDIIAKNGGKVVKQEYWGLKDLAYVIKKNKKGHYILFIIDASFETMQEFERLMSLHEDVIRSMTLKIDSVPEGPSIMLKSHDEEEETENA